MYYFDRFFNIFINKICGILIVIILMLVAFFIGLWHTDAASIRDMTVDNLRSPVFFYPFNCTSASSCSSDTFSVANSVFVKNNFFFTTNTTSIHNSGVYINYKIDSVLQPGYLYSIASYICSSTNNLLPINSFTAIGGNSYGGSMVYSSKTYGYYSSDQVYFYSLVNDVPTQISVYGGRNIYGTMSQCGIYYDVFSPGTTSTWYGLQLTRETVANDVKFLLLGYNLTELGLYTGSLNNEISNVISNSNLATNEDIEELNNEIKNQVQEQQQTNNKLDDLNNNITSDDTSGGESQGSSFFNDFSVSDNGGISGIITSPLRLINNLISSNNLCADLSFNLSIFGKDKIITIDSGCRLWNKAKQPAVLTYHVLLCGLTGYGLMIHLFKVIDKLKDPDESEVETLDL